MQLTNESIYSANQKQLAVRQPGLARILDQGQVNGPEIHLRCSMTQSEWQCSGYVGHFPQNSNFGLDTIVADKPMYLLYGFGDGAFLRRILQNQHVKQLLIFEPSVSLLKDVFSQVDVREILQDDRVELIVGGDASSYLSHCEQYLQARYDRLIAAGNFGNLITLGIEKIPGYQNYLVKFSESFRAAIENLLRTDTGFSQEDAFFGLRNTVRNAKTCEAFCVMPQFKGKFSGLPGIVIGSGPSLKYAIPYLRTLQDHAVLFACDSSVKSLLAAGIEPHFVGCLERVSATKRLFDGLQTLKRSCLVSPSSIQPESILAFPGERKILIQRDIGFDRWLFPEIPGLNLGQTVSHLGLMGLRELGCSEIYLMGVDCAYDPKSGLSHIEDAADFIIKYGEWEKNNNSGVNQLVETGYDGQPKKTMSIWFSDTLIFRDLIRAYGLQVTNVMPSEYGIPIPGTMHIEPEQILERIHIKENPDQILGALYAQANQKHYDADKLISESLEFLKFVQEYSMHMMSQLSRFWHDYDPCIEEYQHLFRDLFEKVEQGKNIIMHQQGGYFWRLLFPIVQNFHVRNGYQVQHCFVEYPDAGLRMTRQVQLYLEWYTKIHSWSSRVLDLMINKK